MLEPCEGEAELAFSVSKFPPMPGRPGRPGRLKLKLPEAQ